MERPFQAYDGADPYVFVCYSHDDKALVYPEITRLRESGFNIWYDEGIAPGSEWSDMLANHIEGCAVFLYFVSPRSVTSEHCRREVNFALEHPCGMLAVHVERTDLPGGLKLTLSNRQAILKYDDPQAVYEAKLARAIRDAQTHDGGEAATSTLTLGDWTLDVATQRLMRGQETHVLDPKAQSVLLHLVDRAPEVVSREGLMSRTWPDVVVGENVLDQAIAQLRRAFNDDAREPTYIETLPKRGYRLLVSPDSVDPAATRTVDAPRSRTKLALLVAALAVAAGGWWTLTSIEEPTTRTTKIAVLAFEDLTPDGSLPWLANGLSFELNNQINQASQLLGYTVIPSALLAGQTAQDLPDDVDLVVSGNVQEGGGGITVNVEVIKMPGGERVWSESFLGTLTDPLALQRQIGSQIARYFQDAAIGTGNVTDWPMSGPSAPEARSAYFRYLHDNAGGHPDESLYWLERTLEFDPAWARGWADLANHLMSRGGPSWVERAREALNKARALGLEDDVGLAMAEALLLWQFDGDFDAAERKLRAPATIFPGGYAYLMLASGLTEEAEPVLSSLTARAPWMTFVWDWLAQARAANGDLEAAYQAARQIENLSAPHSYSLPWLPLIILTPLTGRMDEAQRHLETLVELANQGTNTNAAGMRDVAASAIALAENDTVTLLQLAEAHLAAGDHANAAHWFLQIGDPRAGASFSIAAETFPRSIVGISRMAIRGDLRNDPAYRAFLDALGFTKEWRLELCRRAATLPPETGITCDPSKYALDVADA